MKKLCFAVMAMCMLLSCGGKNEKGAATEEARISSMQGTPLKLIRKAMTKSASKQPHITPTATRHTKVIISTPPRTIPKIIPHRNFCLYSGRKMQAGDLIPSICSSDFDIAPFMRK